MTEAEWLTSADPYTMLQHFEDIETQRKMRLFAEACNSRTIHCVKIECVLLARSVLSQNTEFGLSWDMLHSIEHDVMLTISDDALSAETAMKALYVISNNAHTQYYTTWFARCVVDEAIRYRPTLRAKYVRKIEERWQVSALYDIFGNPFHPISADPTWLTPTVVALAEGVYQERAFDRLPVLADALEEAGCDNEDILSHCRGDGPHVKGCWVVDLLTGRK